MDIKKKHIGYNVILEVNEIEAATVQSVFQAHADEITIYEIVKKLNEENQHNRSWTQNFVSRMLKNPFYKGTYLAGKTKKLFDSSLVFRNPMDSWIKIENHHEAIITADLFDKVQNIFQTKRSMLSQIIRSKKIVYPEKYTAHIAPRKCDALCNVRPQPILEVQGFYVK